MNPALKQRLVGATVLVILAVIFIPMLLQPGEDEVELISRLDTPDRPGVDFLEPIEELNEIKLPPPKTPAREIAEPSAKVTSTPKSSEAPPPTPPKAVPAPSKAPTAPVKVTKTTPKASKPAATPTKQGLSSPDALTAWMVQVGSFEGKERAIALRDRLRKAGFPTEVSTFGEGKKTSYKVRVGPYIKKSEAEAMRSKLAKEQKLDGWIAKHSD